MNGKERSRSNESLCEKSMLLVANIIKLSTSLSFTKMSHGTTTAPTSRRRSAAVPAAASRLQEPQSRPKPIYVTEPKYSSYVIDEDQRDLDDENVDGWASKYIEKVHKKNQKDLEETTIMKKKKKPYSNLTSSKVATVLN